MLQSHYFEGQPPFLLKEHIDDVKRAAEFLLARHTMLSRYPQTAHVLEAIVCCHDLGKGSAGFQSYIKNPNKYRGGKKEKNHAVLSAALAILWAKQQNWDAFDTLVLAQTVVGHHSGCWILTSKNEDNKDKTLYDCLRDGEKQWATLNYHELSKATGLSLEHIVDEFKGARRWLFSKSGLNIEEKLEKLPLPESLTFRLWTQYLFSILLEADKALLALRQSDSHRYFRENSTPHALSPDSVHQYLSKLPPIHFDNLRQTARQRVAEYSKQHSQERCFTLTLPTGVGKTLLAASWALEQRQQMRASGMTPKIVIVLPFLSIVDQTETIYRQLLAAPDKQSDLLMASHSLAQRQWDSESDENSSAFFLDIWRSEVVITTFDQFLLALFSPKTKYLMRFHHLMDALIILDEVQTLPIKLWDLVNQTVQNLVQLGNTKMLLMSATQPDLLQPAVELAGDQNEVQQLFKQCKRYRIVLKHQKSQSLDEFIEHLIPRVTDWLANGQRPLITLNTRASAKKVWQALQQHFEKQLPVYLISADLIPRDRLQKIAAIKTGEPCIVVSTQTIEAGVDIDMDVVIRDFAPLDALIQIAGRCNRNFEKGEYGGYVEIVSLISKNGKKYTEYVYDKTILNATSDILTSLENIVEEDILSLIERYFSVLKNRKDTGKSLTKNFAYWEEMEDVHNILRPQLGEQMEFLVIDDAEGQRILEQLQQAFKIEDRWEKRLALQALAGDLNKRTVTAYKRKGFHPEDYIDSRYLDFFEKHDYAILKAKYYDTQQGMTLPLDEDDPAVCIV